MNAVRILNTSISETSVDEVAESLVNESNLTVALCNTNTVVRCYRDDELCKKINSFDIRTSDGFPIAKASSLLYKNKQQRVDGYKVLLKTIEEGISKGTTHYFFGGEDVVLNKLIDSLKANYPEIKIAGYSSPPFASYEELAEENYVKDVLEKKPDIFWVSLGFPKQEQFIHLIHDKYNMDSNLVGIGAVFEWVAGTKIKAPEFLANLGFEWILRLIQEPKRLYKRYFIDNFLFLFLIIKQSWSKN